MRLNKKVRDTIILIRESYDFAETKELNGGLKQ